MAKGPSGKIVIEVEPPLKRALHARLAAEQRSMKDWFIQQAEEYLRAQERLPYAVPEPPLLQVAEPVGAGFQRSSQGNRSTR